ncbi:unnamed protein product [Cuscuta campestris]|uniref:Uncharacterized protein n=1 Tax=Cuscuta campestris TaxID=132261 RepID=A0A484MGR7_9ASTE|nr:unnamed protein product [Cuscuta campestris]
MVLSLRGEIMLMEYPPSHTGGSMTPHKKTHLPSELCADLSADSGYLPRFPVGDWILQGSRGGAVDLENLAGFHCRSSHH